MAHESGVGRNRVLPGLLLALVPWALLAGGGGCLGGGGPAPPTELCPGPDLNHIFASAETREYAFTYPGTVVDARGVDVAGQRRSGIELAGHLGGCYQGGNITGTWDMGDTWETFHTTAAVSLRSSASPNRVHAAHLRNYGDGVSIEPTVNCGAFPNWLSVRATHMEDIHDDAIESDGLCSVEIADNLLERTYVAFAFRNRSSALGLSGAFNTVTIDGNLVRAHAFAQNYEGGLTHGGFWKWAHERRGPWVVVRNNRFLAFDPPSGTLLPYLTRVQSCSNNVLLFAGSEAEWAEALLGGCDDDGDDELCDGERLLALSYCYTVITKPDTQSEADFLAAHWDPYVASWKASHLADNE